MRSLSQGMAHVGHEIDGDVEMTILAQQWLESHERTEVDFYLQSKLERPREEKSTIKGDFEETAERIVYDEDLSDVLADLMDNGQISIEMVYTTTRMPARCVWIEWKTATAEGLRIGCTLEVAPDGCIAIVCAASNKAGRSTATFAGEIIHGLPMRHGFRELMFRWAVMGSVKDDHLGQEFAVLVTTAIFGLFLLQQPRTISKQPVAYPEKVQSRRIREHKHPLVEYQRVKILIGGAAKRSGRPSGPSVGMPALEAPGGRRRYHQVLGHFRVYHRNTDMPVSTWIDPYYRGDPSLGVLLRERDVSMAKPELKQEAKA